MQLALLGGAQAQVPAENRFTNETTGLLRVFEYPSPHQKVILEFSQDECQASVAEEYVIPDVPANPDKEDRMVDDQTRVAKIAIGCGPAVDSEETSSKNSNGIHGRAHAPAASAIGFRPIARPLFDRSGGRFARLK